VIKTGNQLKVIKKAAIVHNSAQHVHINLCFDVKYFIILQVSTSCKIQSICQWEL